MKVRKSWKRVKRRGEDVAEDELEVVLGGEVEQEDNKEVVEEDVEEEVVVVEEVVGEEVVEEGVEEGVWMKSQMLLKIKLTMNNSWW